MHKRSLERFDFDSVLMPWNWFAAHHESYGADFEATVALCEERKVAVQTIKSLARGPWAAGVARTHNTWYQPLEDEEDIRTAVHWLLSRRGIFLNSVGDVTLLPKVLRAADELGTDHLQVPEAAMISLQRASGVWPRFSGSEKRISLALLRPAPPPDHPRAYHRNAWTGGGAGRRRTQAIGHQRIGRGPKAPARSHSGRPPETRCRSTSRTRRDGAAGASRRPRPRACSRCSCRQSPG